MSIFNRSGNKNKIKKRLTRWKKTAIVAKSQYKLPIVRFLSIAMVAVLVVGGGFMGISSFIPEERSINLSETPAMAAVDSVRDKAASESVTTAKTEQPSQNQDNSNNAASKSGDINPSGMTVDAKSAVLMDADSGTILFSQNGDDPLPPASVTKVMTMLLAMEAIDQGRVSCSDMITISERAASMGGSQMYMEPGEQHSLEELMEGISMVSANDACVAVAEYLSGSVEIFVENMNARARELGMENTHFVNTNGLPVADHYTSAHDIAIMSSELIKHKKTHEWFTNWQDTLTVGLPGKQKEFGLTNTNRLIKQYSGANGIKTGFTQEAGYCLSGSATRDDMTLIAVVLGCPSSKIRFAEAAKLLDYGFATYETVKLAEKGEPHGLVEIQKGQPNYINAVAGSDISILVKKGEKDSVTFEVEQDNKIKAPIKKGAKLGEIVAYQNKKEIGRYPLIAEESSKEATLVDLYQRITKSMINTEKE
ncbi:D-alanyl-D-alanine carboxypeptidase family protein [Clostridium aminobutyricum]|uniref:serine-type D-Ala-D-Ala carboxypeptidase n=1 Tax=Clostridium aminobutyricum TaxID=33953 RepID=A0A939D7U5_CLOAM|nr:D-alanyl-D-alanine carboxypeptidase family protein [Clostridium aminobutyricum]MBN7772716.1 D-alanyl-D-alanine carboxypeptidase [Clostridium aminobutyricum]